MNRQEDTIVDYFLNVWTEGFDSDPVDDLAGMLDGDRELAQYLVDKYQQISGEEILAHNAPVPGDVAIRKWIRKTLKDRPKVSEDPIRKKITRLQVLTGCDFSTEYLKDQGTCVLIALSSSGTRSITPRLKPKALGEYLDGIIEGVELMQMLNSRRKS